MFKRQLSSRLLEALADTPVVLVVGARQTGKSTLTQTALPGFRPITFDDDTPRRAALADPAGFLSGLEGPSVLDEVQRVLPLFPALKASVDRDRRPGRFVLTGSANPLLLPRLSETLAGRMEILTLWPLSQAEIHGTSVNLVDALFAQSGPGLRTPETSRTELLSRVLSGGYPEARARPAGRRRSAWFDAYVTTMVTRQVDDLAGIDAAPELTRLLRLLGLRSGGLLNTADLSRDLHIPYTTLRRYLSLLEALYLYQPLLPWHDARAARIVKSPKVYLNDAGLAAHLCGFGPAQIEADPTRTGPLLEAFVRAELAKHAGTSEAAAELFFYRTLSGVEVDFVVERRDGALVGVEVKAASTVVPKDVKGLRHLAEVAGERFVRGVVLYTGHEVVPLGERLEAWPVSMLWEAPVGRA